jgi:SAM-dependent methyltransferase
MQPEVDVDNLSAAYSPKFFEMIGQTARKSAMQIVPIIVGFLHPRSIVDVGCGVGTWLKVFQENGIPDVLGLDGPWVRQDSLEISTEQFRVSDLAQPLAAARRFDLVVSLEVAEHLPPASAKRFVESLTALGDIVLFSAAVPHQGGVNHTNEQWPEYWAGLFEQRGYAVADWLRPRIWASSTVSWCMRRTRFCSSTRGSSRPVRNWRTRSTRRGERNYRSFIPKCTSSPPCIGETCIVMRT